jgi:MSHA pilin protein MshC
MSKQREEGAAGRRLLSFRRDAMNAQRRSQYAFTLVEVVTVVAVMAILAAVIGPRFLTMTTFRERGYADEIAGALRYAQRIAMTSSCNVRFTLTTTGYDAAQRASKANCTSNGSWNREVLLPNGNALAGTTPSGVTVGAATIELDGTGKPVATVAPIAVGAFSVTIDSVVGRVAVQ